MKYTIGIDYGTLSCRAAVINAENGQVLGIGECGYHVYEDALPTGAKLPPRMALADPGEYMETLQKAVRTAVSAAKVEAEKIVGLAVDATSMSVLPCDAAGLPLCWQSKWKNEPQAYIRLWKSYTATAEAEEIGALARAQNKPFVAACGGYPSSEGIYPKMLETLLACADLYAAADIYVDLNEWITWRLTGRLTRSAGSMGLKNYCFDGKLTEDAAFWSQLHPALADVARKLRGEILPWGACAGTLTAEMADLLGLPAGIAVGAGGLDGHVPAMALGLKNDGDAMMTIGTSGVLGVLSQGWHTVPGVCGAAYNAMIPGLYAYDFCQSGVGDMFGWFVDNCVPARYEREAAAQGISVHTLLSRLGFALPVRADAPVAVDWWNGSRCVVVDQTLAGAVSGLRLSTKPEEVYRALVEAAAFGMRTMLEHAQAHGVEVKRICVCGGIAVKNPLLVQCYADILGRELLVSSLPNSVAVGSAIGAAAAAGLYANLPAAMDALASQEFICYRPDMEKHAAYTPLYARYQNMRQAILQQGD